MVGKHVEYRDIRIRVHLGVVLVALAAYVVVAIAASFSPYFGGALALGIALLTLRIGFRIERSSLPGADSLVGLVWTVSAAFLGLAVVGLAGSLVIAPGVVLSVAVVTTVYCGVLYLLNGTAWLEGAFIAGVAGTLVAAFAMRPEIPLSATGYMLLVLSAYVALGGVRGVLQPALGAYVAACLVASAGALVLLHENNPIGFFAAVAVGVVTVRGLADGSEGWRRRFGTTTLDVTYPWPSVFDALTAGLMHRHAPIRYSDPVRGQIVAAMPTGGVVRLELSSRGDGRTLILATGDINEVPALVNDVREALDFSFAA